MKTVDIYTDGACSGNPGPGGWAAILIYNGTEKEISGYVQETTNNRMELFAAIMGIGQLKQPCRVRLYSDSSYLISAFNNGWLKKWQTNGWKSGKDPVKNQDLWRDLLLKTDTHDVEWIKVKGHGDNEYNNRCDQMAVAAIQQSRET